MIGWISVWQLLASNSQKLPLDVRWVAWVQLFVLVRSWSLLVLARNPWHQSVLETVVTRVHDTFVTERKTPIKADARRLTPLWIISLFVGLSETVLGVAATQITGNLQISLVAFVMIFPTVCAAAFFVILWARPWVFYSPNEYGGVDPAKFVETLSQAQFARVTRTADLPKDTIVVGNPDAFALLFKVNGPTWKKSTKAMSVRGGCLVQVSTEVLGADGSVDVAEALTFVPGVSVKDDAAGEGRHLVSIL